MKKFVKLAAVFAALVLALSCFVSCSSDDDDDSSSGGSVVAVYKDDSVTTATFYGNGTFEAVMEISGVGTEKEASGTYTGDPSKDGEITMTYTFIDGYDYNKDWYDNAGIALNKAVTVKITDGKCEILGSVYTLQN